MKQRRVERVERRRPNVDLNMAADSKVLSPTPKGFLAFLRRLLSGQR